MFAAQLRLLRQQLPPQKTQTTAGGTGRDNVVGDIPPVSPAMLSTKHEKQDTAMPSQEGHTQTPHPMPSPHLVFDP